MSDGSAIVPVAAALGLSFDFGIDEKRRLVVQTHLPADAQSAEINGMMDRVFKALDRQEAIYRLRGLTKQRAAHDKTLRQIVDDMGAIETRIRNEWAEGNRRGEPKLSAKEDAEKKNAASTRERYKLEISIIDAEIADCKAAIEQQD